MNKISNKNVKKMIINAIILIFLLTPSESGATSCDVKEFKKCTPKEQNYPCPRLSTKFEMIGSCLTSEKSRQACNSLPKGKVGCKVDNIDSHTNVAVCCWTGQSKTGTETAFKMPMCSSYSYDLNKEKFSNKGNTRICDHSLYSKKTPPPGQYTKYCKDCKVDANGKKSTMSCSCKQKDGSYKSTSTNLTTKYVYRWELKGVADFNKYNAYWPNLSTSFVEVKKDPIWGY